MGEAGIIDRNMQQFAAGGYRADRASGEAGDFGIGMGSQQFELCRGPWIETSAGGDGTGNFQCAPLECHHVGWQAKLPGKLAVGSGAEPGDLFARPNVTPGKAIGQAKPQATFDDGHDAAPYLFGHRVVVHGA